MAEQTLHRLCVALLINQERRQRVAQIVETETLSRLKHNASRDSSQTEVICCKNAGRSRLTALQFGGRKNPVARLTVWGLLVPTLKTSANVGLIVAGASDCSVFMRSTTLLSSQTRRRLIL
jgi:hypothetical protein